MKIITHILKFYAALILVGSVAFAQEISTDQNENTPPADYPARAFSEADFSKYPALKEFTNVIVINKANEGSDKQSLRVYVNGKLKEYTRISSGREKFEKGCAPGQTPKRDRCSRRAYWSETPVGHFHVDELVENYLSKLWETWMPYSVFFESGIAFHQAPAGSEAKIGQRASGGCVRLHPSIAPKIYFMVEKAGKGLVPKMGRNGEPLKTSRGDIIRWQGYKTLVIVHNVIE